MSIWTIGWLVILGAGGIWEGLALASGRSSPTLSGHVWQWFAIKGVHRFKRTRRTVLLAAMVWLTVHFMTGGAV